MKLIVSLLRMVTVANKDSVLHSTTQIQRFWYVVFLGAGLAIIKLWQAVLIWVFDSWWCDVAMLNPRVGMAGLSLEEAHLPAVSFDSC
jgi:hypothetical protein